MHLLNTFVLFSLIPIFAVASAWPQWKNDSGGTQKFSAFRPTSSGASLWTTATATQPIAETLSKTFQLPSASTTSVWKISYPSISSKRSSNPATVSTSQWSDATTRSPESTGQGDFVQGGFPTSSTWASATATSSWTSLALQTTGLSSTHRRRLLGHQQ